MSCSEIMFSSAFKADRLQVNLQLVINHLKLLEKKKTEQTQKARKEIADYLATGKDERAQIRVEHIIREDYLVEAMEILELHCDLLLARFSLIQATKYVVTKSVVFFVLQLMYKLNVNTLPQVLVEQYLVEIAKSYNVPHESKVAIMAEVPEDLVSTGSTRDVKKDALGREGGTVGGNGDPPGALPTSTPGPSLLPSLGPRFPPLPPGRQNDDYKNELLPSVVPTPGLNPQTSPQPESRAKIGFHNSLLSELPDVKPHTSLSIDPYDSEEVDIADLNRRLEMLKKMT